ncbi:MAG: peptide ABC transporter ATP-binding protein [Nitrospiraceae bacterium]|nr:peptide ABC transporter ATP-binding protein [Nitrospiraceae bacterium]
MSKPNTPLLDVRNLSTSFFTEKGEVGAVQDVSFQILPGETLALVGESGCGKSVTALSIMQLLDYPGKVVNGQIIFNGQDLTKTTDHELRNIRGNKIGMIFQEPMTSLNPVFRIGEQIGEALFTHKGFTKEQSRTESLRLLDRVEIPSSKRRIDQYPHELSGGMKQRVMIAMALACSPDLLIADEPTTALDVTIQAQILDLVRTLQSEMGMAILLITHNLGIVAQFARNVVVMYASKIVEQTDVMTLFKNPQHPYTKALLNALPRPDHPSTRLASIDGMVPSPLLYPQGCHFAPRCKDRLDHCMDQNPSLIQTEPAHETACWLCEKSEAG